ncbi:MAG: hypothetical protein RL087_1025 [Pseudomonadota bacterium]
MGLLDKLRSDRPAGADRADAQARRSVVSTQPDSTFGAQEPTTLTMSTVAIESTTLGDASTLIRPDFADSRLHAALSSARPLPLLGGLAPAVQRSVLQGIVAVGVVAIGVALFVALSGGSAPSSSGAAAWAEAQVQAHRLARASQTALSGQAPAITEVADSAKALEAALTALGGAQPELAESLGTLRPTAERVARNAAALGAQQASVAGAAKAAAESRRLAAALQEPAEALASAKLQSGAAAAEVSAAERLVTLSERIGRAAGEIKPPRGAEPEVLLLLGKDVEAFGRGLDVLSAGDAAQRIAPPRDLAQVERLKVLVPAFNDLRAQVTALTGAAQGLLAARAAQSSLLADAEALARGLATMRPATGAAGASPGWLFVGFGGLLLAMIGAAGFLRLVIHEQSSRSQAADTQRAEAERQEQEAKRVNDANQAAILRLMNELQAVAEGDLTQQATVTEDITGAIADSVNYTVEELRTLVSQVQSTVGRVTATTEKVEETSTELLAASAEQLHEIHETGEAVLRMASRINDISSQAQLTAEVAQDSLKAAESGLTAVQNSIGGMNTIREQIQDTSKRIKRLGESSQEIGEITELISDITEQTNVLAINAAIQAASAGDAGRGFSVVAEEVQRLAERSADATRQIAALVRAIQTDTQDAVAAMERSTQGVVEGAHLSDAAGTALGEIDRVTRELSELIGRISSQALEEAASANVVATNIQHIFAVTEQTSGGTKSTAQMVRELSRTAEELRSSVARFKVG